MSVLPADRSEPELVSLVGTMRVFGEPYTDGRPLLLVRARGPLPMVLAQLAANLTQWRSAAEAASHPKGASAPE